MCLVPSANLILAYGTCGKLTCDILIVELTLIRTLPSRDQATFVYDGAFESHSY